MFGLVEEFGGVCCPECGEQVELDLVIRQVRVRKVHTTLRYLALCIATFVPVLCAAGLCLFAGRLWSVIALAFCAGIWLAGLELYRHHHRTVEYAGIVLVMFHIGFILISVGALMLAYILFDLFSTSRVLSYSRTLMVVPLTIPLFWIGSRFFSRACGLIEDGHDMRLRRMLEHPLNR